MTCKAHRRNGLPCKGSAIRGATVCRLHGGSAPQVRDAARRRLLAAAVLRTIAATREARKRRSVEVPCQSSPRRRLVNAGTETRHALAAIIQVLDRAGIVAPAASGEGTDGAVLWDEFVRIILSGRSMCLASSLDSVCHRAAENYL